MLIKKNKTIALIISALALVMFLALFAGCKHEETAKNYSVTFMVDGNTVSTQTYDWDEAATFPSDPTKDGYAFIGWFDGETQVTEIAKGYKQNVTLNAKWEIINYSVTYELNGGTNSSDNPATYNIESSDVTLAEPDKAGYKFLGWYEGNNEITEITKELKRNITLTAKWEIDAASTVFTFDDSSEEYVITGLKDDNVADIIVPDYVTAIADNAFLTNSYIETVKFAEGSKCQSIGMYAFQYCENLKSAELPASLQSLSYCLFYGCMSLESITFAENSQLETICGGSLHDCYALERIKFPSSVKIIESAAIQGCTSLKEVTFEQGSRLQTVESFNFALCPNLEILVLPQGLTDIGIANDSYPKTIDKIMYCGNETQWNAISGTADMTNQTGATIYYYSETKPASAGNYWHYVDGVVKIW